MTHVECPIWHAFALGVAVLSLAAPASAQPGPILVAPATGPETIVHRYASEGAGSVNTYWVDAPEGLIVIDFQRDTATAALALEEIRRSGRRVVALLLTHPHPDHIGGLAQFKAAYPNAPIYASEATAEEVREDREGFQALTREVLGTRAPMSYPVPDQILVSGAEISIAGLQVVAVELGRGEAVSATAFYFPASGALFSGDIAVAGMTNFLLEGHTSSWLTQIDRLADTFPAARTLYPGHGDSGLPRTIYEEAQAALRLYRSAVQTQITAGRAPSGALSVDGQDAVVDIIRRELGDLPPVALIPDLIRENAKAVARELTTPSGRSLR